MNPGPDPFGTFFLAATGHQPFNYQRRLAESNGDRLAESLLINVPTGLGKTAAVVLAWLWNRLVIADPSERSRSPRRLVYCLPMRTLVEQTQREIEKWLQGLHTQADKIGLGTSSKEHLQWLVAHSPVVLMGGEDIEPTKRVWDNHPEEPCIIVGTQDMLLSRALNRGFGAGRARWPKDFALLNNDCLWVFDEVQLMGSGFATSLQLQAWREELRLRKRADSFREPKPDTLAGPSHSWWMSATLDRNWLDHGVDYRNQVGALWAKCKTETERLWTDDLRTDFRVEVLLTQNKKSLQQVSVTGKFLKLKKDGDAEYLSGFANAVRAQMAGDQLVLVIVNTVGRAISLAEKLKDKQPLLLHSRFRARERKQQVERLRGHTGLVIATQVVEAGVDLSAKVLFTEACPWPSFIQRVGRCARGFDWREEKPVPQEAVVFWTDVSEGAAPYESNEVTAMVSELAKLSGRANIEGLKEHDDRLDPADRRRLLPYEPRFVPRDKDLFDLFDTTPDLTGADVDISRFIRDADELDVQVFWRDCSNVSRDAPPKSWHPQHVELCSVPCRVSDGNFWQFAQQMLRSRIGRIWRWDYSDGWTPLSLSERDRIYPGQVFLLEASCGGYDISTGWTGNPENDPWKIDPGLLGPWEKGVRTAQEEQEDPDKLDESDALSETGKAGQWRDIFTHTREVCDDLDSLLRDSSIAASVPDSSQRVLRLAARLHDWGKAHEAFQAKLTTEAVGSEHRREHYPVGKAPDDCWRRDHLKRQPVDTAEDLRDKRRPRFRHELASALAILELLQRAKFDHDAVTWPGNELRDALGVAECSASEPLPDEAASLGGEVSALSTDEFDLLLYLVAAHHGKVRMSLRGTPDDNRDDVPEACPPDKRQARGVREDDELPAVTLPGLDSGTTVTAPKVVLHLDPMELGLGARYGRSWRERTQNLLETNGPFRLAWYETLLRIADGRASRRAENNRPESR